MINYIFGNAGRGFGQSLVEGDGAIWKGGRNVKFTLKVVQCQVNLEESADQWDFKISSSKDMIFCI